MATTAQSDTDLLPALPAGWRHSALVARVADRPRERRETLLTVMFAVAAAVWAPLGVVAFFAGRAGAFFLLTLVVVLVAVAPRPTALAASAASLRAHLRPAVAGARDLAGRLAAGSRAIAASLGEQLRSRAAGLADRRSTWSGGHRSPRSTR